MRALIEEQEESEDPALKDELDVKARLQLRQLISILRQREASENVPLGKPLDGGAGARRELRGHRRLRRQELCRCLPRGEGRKGRSRRWWGREGSDTPQKLVIDQFYDFIFRKGYI
jgi:hypothetical protein